MTIGFFITFDAVPVIFYPLIATVLFLLISKVVYLFFPDRIPKVIPFSPPWLTIICIPLLRLLIGEILGNKQQWLQHILNIFFTPIIIGAPLGFLILYLKIPSNQFLTFACVFLISIIGALFLFYFTHFFYGKLIIADVLYEPFVSWLP